MSDVVLQTACRNRILKDLPDLTLHNALARSSLTDFPHGRKLYRENGPIENVYFPTSGVVSILVGAFESGDVEMATIGNEGLVGVTLLMGVPRALGRTIFQISGQAIVISARHFDELLRHEQHFSRLIHRYLYAFIRQIMQAGACNRLHTVEERCARWLLMTHDRAGTDEFTLTQNFLAEMMGTRRAAVNLTLATFRRTGALEYVYRRITILDRKQLESFSCPCYNAIRQAYGDCKPVDCTIPINLTRYNQLAMAKPVILVVDDEPVVLDIVRAILAPASYHVLAADDGAAALQLSRSYGPPIDLLLTDVKMPKMTGPDLAEVMVKERPGIRILLMSGHPSGEIPQHLRSKLLRKPFLPEELLGRIEQTLSSAPDCSL